MGSIVIQDIPECINYTRNRLITVINKSFINPYDFMILCILITQYLALLYADRYRKVTGKGNNEYLAFPMKAVSILPYPYQRIASSTVTKRNILCHEFGSISSDDIFKTYRRFLHSIEELINDVIFDDNLLSTDTGKALHNL